MPAERRRPAENSAGAEERGPEGSSRRVLALVLPSLLCELAESPLPEISREKAARDRASETAKPARAARLPRAVVLTELESNTATLADPARREELTATSVLSAVNDAARKLGVREGQTIAEARALAARLIVHGVARAALERGLGRIAEMALGFGALVSFSAPDTVWVDVTGVAHLFGGEAALAAELVSRVGEAGYRGRVAIADGPVMARAVARFGDVAAEGYRIVPSARTKQELSRLPLRALGLPLELESWFVRLGLLTLADLETLPRNALAARLGDQASRVLELLRGVDTTPLVRYDPPRTLCEETSWDDAVAGSEPLLFVLRGLVARLSARLRGRGEAARSLALTILADGKIARFRGAPPRTKLDFSLPKPIYREQELGRILSSRLERVELGAPSVGLRLEVLTLTEAMPRQLELGSLLAGTKREAQDELPIVLAELAADIGEERIGVLAVVDSHRPELRSKLVPALESSSEKPRIKKTRAPLVLTTVARAARSELQRLTRLLPEPIPFEAPLSVGSSVVLDRRLYTIESLSFEERLEAVEWWQKAVNRDYVRVVLKGDEGRMEGMVYVDRDSGARYWQGVFD